MTSTAPFPQRALGDVLDELATPDRAPGGLPAAAVACALAAGLVESISGDGEDPLAMARLARSSALRGRVLELVGRDAPETVAPTALAIASSAAQLTSLAAEAVTGASDAVVAEAVVAAELADGACRAATHVVRIALRDAPADPRRTEAMGLVRASAEALQDAFAGAAEAAGVPSA